MSDPVPTSAGWYPDPDTGGTKYWDGSRWTGDTPSSPKPSTASRRLWLLGILSGVIVVLACAWAFFSTGLAVLLTSIALAGGAAYAMRYERIRRGVVRLAGLAFVGLTAILAEIFKRRRESRQQAAARLENERLEKELEEQLKAQNKAELRAAFLSRIARPKRNDASEAAQINALADPETAKALQNLQNLLYTQVLTEAEFQAAKDRLLGGQ